METSLRGLDRDNDEDRAITKQMEISQPKDALLIHLRQRIALFVVLLALTLNAAIFGFFYAWVCSTMWGLDQADPRVAIQAMQAMNASVRNGVFAPAFFGTPIALAIAAAVLWTLRARKSALCFVVSAAIYFCFGLLLTMLVNVPMNNALAMITSVPADVSEARLIWHDYSQPWQFWNQVRAAASGVSFLVAAYGGIGAFSDNSQKHT